MQLAKKRDTGELDFIQDKDIVPPAVEIPSYDEHQKESPEIAQDPGSTPHTIPVKGKAPKNYAASSCAKIDKHSPDLLNAKYVLRKGHFLAIWPISPFMTSS